MDDHNGSPEVARDLAAVVTLLNRDDADWDELEQILIPYSGWLGLVRQLRYPAPAMDNRIVWGRVELEFMQISPRARTALLDLFEPFQVLTDTELIPAQKIAKMQSMGGNARRFCKDNVNHAIPEIALEAKKVLDAMNSKASLLRTRSAEASSDQLPRVAERTDSQLPPVSAPWLYRIVASFKKR